MINYLTSFFFQVWSWQKTNDQVSVLTSQRLNFKSIWRSSDAKTSSSSSVEENWTKIKIAAGPGKARTPQKIFSDQPVFFLVRFKPVFVTKFLRNLNRYKNISLFLTFLSKIYLVNKFAFYNGYLQIYLSMFWGAIFYLFTLFLHFCVAVL